MSFNLASLSAEAVIKAPRILLLGVEKIGKTTFACGARVEDGQLVEVGLNKPVVIPVRGEEGADEFAVAKFPTAQSFDDVLSAISSLYTEEHAFETVVIDSASALEPLIHDKVCADYKATSIEEVLGGYGKGFGEAMKYWRGLTNGLDALRNSKDMRSIIVGHIKIKGIKNPGTDAYDAFQFDINERASQMLLKWADLILFANSKITVRKEDVGFNKTKARAVDAAGGQRFLYTQKHPAYPAGGRGVLGRLPNEIPLDWATFQDAVASAYKTQQQQQ